MFSKPSTRHASAGVMGSTFRRRSIAGGGDCNRPVTRETLDAYAHGDRSGGERPHGTQPVAISKGSITALECAVTRTRSESATLPQFHLYPGTNGPDRVQRVWKGEFGCGARDRWTLRSRKLGNVPREILRSDIPAAHNRDGRAGQRSLREHRGCRRRAARFRNDPRCAEQPLHG